MFKARCRTVHKTTLSMLGFGQLGLAHTLLLLHNCCNFICEVALMYLENKVF